MSDTRYASAKIYALKAPSSDKMCIGSTIIELHRRFSLHKAK